MAKAYASTIVDAPVEAVWAETRDFNGLPSWNPGVTRSEIEDGMEPDVVGCIRSFHLADGTHVRERLISLDDSRYTFSYSFETPAFPVENYLSTFQLIPVTDGDRTFVQWEADFDEAPEDRGKYVEIVSKAVFAAGLEHLGRKLKGAQKPSAPERWKGLRPAKVFCSSVIEGPIDAVWERMRDFAGMGGWHPDISQMVMLGDKRSDKVSGVRDFLFGEGRLWEELTLLCDRTKEFRYRILRSPMPWLNYHAGSRLYPITSSNRTFAVWTADWVASATDDLELIPNVHHNVFQRAFDTLNERYFAHGS